MCMNVFLSAIWRCSIYITQGDFFHRVNGLGWKGPRRSPSSYSTAVGRISPTRWGYSRPHLTQPWTLPGIRHPKLLFFLPEVLTIPIEQLVKMYNTPPGTTGLCDDTCDDRRFVLISCSVLISNACVYWTDTYILNINAVSKLNESFRENRVSDLIR